MEGHEQRRKSAGGKFRKALGEEAPLQVVGAITAYAARMAEATGFKALYLSGGGVAANSLGMPDLGISTMEDVLTDARRITNATTLPLLVDIDTGWGGAFNIARTIRSMEQAGVAAVHMEDQVGTKRCGHRPGKEIVSQRGDGGSHQGGCGCADRSEFVMMARTDALGGGRVGGGAGPVRGVRGSGRGHDLSGGGDGSCVVSEVQGGGEGADSGEHYGVRAVRRCIRASSWAGRGWILCCICCSAYRAMNAAALKVYKAIRAEGTQQGVLEDDADASGALRVSRVPRV